MAAWLVNDDYDYAADPNYISATSLLKPVKSIVLGNRNDAVRTEDLSDLIARSLGNAIHDSVEKAWTHNYEKNLKALGYSDSLISRVVVNPGPADLVDDSIPIFFEQRAKKKVGKYTIGGKFDMCLDGELHDIKSTSAFNWVYGGNDEDYGLQGSIYKFLHPEIITSDYITILFVFTDWKKADVGRVANYPDSRIKARKIPLMSIEQTEQWIKKRLREIDRIKDLPEDRMPDCTSEELWLNKPKHRYYKDPNKTTRATRTFDTYAEAVNLKIQNNGAGLIISEPLVANRCNYCSAFEICKQKDIYIND